MLTILRAARAVLAARGYRLLAAASFLFFSALYLMTLPAAYTGGRIGPATLRYLTPELAAIALLLGGLLALMAPLMVYAWRQRHGISAGTAASGALVGFFAPLLCCSPLLPSALGVLAAFFPALAGSAAGSVQGFIATHETAILLASLGLVAWAVYLNARRATAGAHCSAPSPRSARVRGAERIEASK